MQRQSGLVATFVDWENIRQRLADNYREKVPIEQVLKAIEKVCAELGNLRECLVFGDWSLRREEAGQIQNRPKFRPYMVLRSGSKDQTDPAMIAEIFEAIVNRASLGVDQILVCAGDSNYADIIRRGFARGVRMNVCAVGKDVSSELTALAPFFPLERYLEQPPTPKQPIQQQPLEGFAIQVTPMLRKLVEVLDSLDKKLPYVAYLYFRDKIMPSYALLSQDPQSLLMEADRLEIVRISQRENPVNPGNLFRCISLNREHTIVKQILTPPKM